MIIDSKPDTTCLITGANGYLGKCIYNYLEGLGWRVKTLGLKKINFYQCDLRENAPDFEESVDVVVHCAGKAHLFPNSDADRKDFFDVNVQGTRNLLNALSKVPNLPKAIVLLSSVSVYGLNEGELVNENTPLKSEYAYGQSKIEAEKILVEWCIKNQVRYTILRVPLVAGKNPPGNLKNMITSIKRGYYFNVSDSVRRSVVMVDDVAKIIPIAISVGGIYNLTDGDHPHVKDLAELISKQLEKKRPLSIPRSMAKLLSLVAVLFSPLLPEQAFKLKKLMTSLTFDDSKARKMLGWNPSKVLDKFIIE